jgi:hypothetical protein
MLTVVERPLKIFRYYKAEHGLKVLNDLEIRASIPTELNDPFELSPTIDAAQFGQRRLEALMRQDYHIDRAYRLEGRQHGFGSKKEFKRWYLKDVPRRAAEGLPKVRKNVEAEMRKFALRFGKYWRLICASQVHDSVLMWSHYADNHTGLVLEFDASQPPFSQIPNARCTFFLAQRKTCFVIANLRLAIDQDLIDVFLRDWHAAPQTKGAAGYLQAGRGLLALVLI